MSRVARVVKATIVAALACGCTDPVVVGEGQFSRPIPLASDPSAPLPRLIWRPGISCPGEPGGCVSYCDQRPEDCADEDNDCLPLLIDSGTPLSFLPSDDGSFSFGKECIELRGGAGIIDTPDDADVLAGTTASFRLRDAPFVRAPRAEAELDGWTWEVGVGPSPTYVGGVIGGNILRDFAIELRHLDGEAPIVAFFSQFPGDERVLADQGRAYVRLQYPGRLLGRLLNDRCEIGEGLDCRLSKFNLNPDSQELLFENTRALVDACVAPPPCAVGWRDESCVLSEGGAEGLPCVHDQGQSATLLVATGVPGLVLFDDSAGQLLGPLAQLPDCAALPSDTDAAACLEPELGRLVLPGWDALEQLVRVRVRSLGLVQGLDQPTGTSPCLRLRNRLQGLLAQCEQFAAEGRPIRPAAASGASIGTSALVIGEVSLADGASGPNGDAWIETLIVPATAAPVIALRREIVPGGAQPDGMIGGAMLTNTETVLDFTEAVEAPGVRVRCLDPGGSCMAIPACLADDDSAVTEIGSGATSCCFGLPPELIARVVLDGEDKQAPRVEDACCPALPRAAITDLQSSGLELCTGVDLP